MKLNSLISSAFVAGAALAAFTALAATPRIHVPANRIPDGISPELVDSLVFQAEQGLERFRMQAVARQGVNVSAPNTSQFVTLQKQRIKVTIDWKDPGSGRSGRAYALPQADTFSFFYYDDPKNPEIFVKVLDFGNTSPFLIFYAGLTSFEYTVTFENVCTGQQAVKFKPGGSAEGGFDNTSLSWCDPLGSPLAAPGVSSLNGLSGDVSLVGTGSASVSKEGSSISINVPPPSAAVPSVNGITGRPVTLTGVGGTSITTSGDIVTISSPSGTGTDTSVLPPIFAVGKRVRRGSSAFTIKAIQGLWVLCDKCDTAWNTTQYVDLWYYIPAQTGGWYQEQ